MESGDSGKVVVITGAARRIGASIARAFHTRGFRVVLHHNQSNEAAASLEREFNGIRNESAKAVRADLCIPNELETLLEAVKESFDRIDVLVNNAASFIPTDIKTTDFDQFEEIINLNLRAPYFLAQELAEPLQQSCGAIVNITDLYAQFPAVGYAVHCASKAGLESLTRSLALELAPDVRVNAIAPGAILWADGQPENSKLVQRTPLRRIGRASEIAAATVFLACDATFMTGQILTIDGGRSILEP